MVKLSASLSEYNENVPAPVLFLRKILLELKNGEKLFLREENKCELNFSVYTVKTDC